MSQVYPNKKAQAETRLKVVFSAAILHKLAILKRPRVHLLQEFAQHMTYAIILIFSMIHGPSHSVDPGRTFSSLAECQQAVGMVHNYVTLRPGERSFVARCVRRRA